MLRRFSGRSLRFVTAAGSRMRPDVVIDFMNHFGDVIYNNYNATEVGAIALAGPADLRAAPDTAGRPMPGTEIRILDEQHRLLPAGEIGAIFARTTTAFEAYTSGQTKEILDGFMATGDIRLPRCRGGGCSWWVDDEMIVSGGENVYPIEVEKVLTTHRAVDDATVLGVDDEVRPAAGRLVVLKPGDSVTAEELKAHVRGELANYKGAPRHRRPRRVAARNAVGKILRRGAQGAVGRHLSAGWRGVMPESARVEALADHLRRHAVGRVVERIDVAALSVLKTFDPPPSALHGHPFSGAHRWGKYLGLQVGEFHLITHPSRAGWLRWSEKLGPAPLKPGRVLSRCASTGDGEGFDLTEAGTQKRLAVWIVRDPAAVPGIAALGPDALELTGEQLTEVLARHTDGSRRS